MSTAVYSAASNGNSQAPVTNSRHHTNQDNAPNGTADGSPTGSAQPNNSDKTQEIELDPNHHPEKIVTWRRVVRSFTPSWFQVNMGTGIVSILLFNLPYPATWLYWLSVVIFCLNVVLFIAFLFISILRYTLYPELWTELIRHPSESMFLGSFPVGLSTIISMIVFVCVPAFGGPEGSWMKLAWGLWWIDAVLSVAVCCWLPFVIMVSHQEKLSTVSGTWLIPLIAAIVAAAVGSVVANVLPDPYHALWTLVVSYVLWGTSVPLSLVVLVIYFQRLTIFRLPPAEVIVSVFIPIGPLGMGGFSIMNLGADAMKIFPKTETLQDSKTHAGATLYVVGWFVAIILWGFALVWLFFAIATIRRTKFPFNMGWWGFTFPLGVFTLATDTFAKEMPSTFFKVLGTVFTVCVTILWLIVSFETIRKAVTGDLLFAPSLKDMEVNNREKLKEKMKDLV